MIQDYVGELLAAHPAPLPRSRVLHLALPPRTPERARLTLLAKFLILKYFMGSCSPQAALATQ